MSRARTRYDREMVKLRPAPSRDKPMKGNAHRSYHHSAVVLCPQRHPKRKTQPGRSHSLCAARLPTSKKAGIRIIQVDEPALREGLPLRRKDWQDVHSTGRLKAFRLATTDVENGTQIHTHMCYCEFEDVLQSIAALDADVISMESARSKMEMLDAFKQHGYPNEIGPGGLRHPLAARPLHR